MGSHDIAGVLLGRVKRDISGFRSRWKGRRKPALFG
jgi:hypothetical protein